MFGGPGANVTDPQSVLPLYLTHDAHTQLLAPYLNSTAYAQTKGKPFLMFETNTVRLCLSSLPTCEHGTN
jgi:hypothetical protein